MSTPVTEVIQELRSTNSKTEKLAILALERDNLPLQTFFQLALNPRIVFGIKKVAMPRHFDGIASLESFFLYADEQAAKGGFKGLQGSADLTLALAKLSRADADTAYRVIMKDPDCGCAVGTVRKTWPNLLPFDAKLCKAQPYSEKNLRHIKWPAISDLKADGARSVAITDYTSAEAIPSATMLSSSGAVIYGLNHIAEELASCFRGYVVDGELVVLDENGVVNRATGNGIVNKAIKGTISPSEAARVHFRVWDTIPLEVYEDPSHEENSPYYVRRSQIRALVSTMRHVSMIESREVNSPREAIAHFNELLARGEEGTILKNRDFKWDGKRLKDCVKFKLELESTLRVVGAIEGNKKYTGMLGALVCESEDGIIRVNVGTGFSDEERKEFWSNWIASGQTSVGIDFIEVRSNGIINGDGAEKFSLYLPRKKDIRLDKLEADTYDDIEALQAAATGLKG